MVILPHLELRCSRDKDEAKRSKFKVTTRPAVVKNNQLVGISVDGTLSMKINTIS